MKVAGSRALRPGHSAPHPCGRVASTPCPPLPHTRLPSSFFPLRCQAGEAATTNRFKPRRGRKSNKYLFRAHQVAGTKSHFALTPTEKGWATRSCRARGRVRTPTSDGKAPALPTTPAASLCRRWTCAFSLRAAIRDPPLPTSGPCPTFGLPLLFLGLLRATQETAVASYRLPLPLRSPPGSRAFPTVKQGPRCPAGTRVCPHRGCDLTSRRMPSET